MSRPANAAGFLIHSAVHQARPDVIAACHTHSVHGMAWSAFGRPLEMLTQDIAYLYGDAQAVYKVRWFDVLRSCLDKQDSKAL
jgi:ribulose-5-phosphate 4-epimerase/fuculose-1-phosphate aldolase